MQIEEFSECYLLLHTEIEASLIGKCLANEDYGYEADTDSHIRKNTMHLLCRESRR